MEQAKINLWGWKAVACIGIFWLCFVDDNKEVEIKGSIFVIGVEEVDKLFV